MERLVRQLHRMHYIDFKIKIRLQLESEAQCNICNDWGSAVHGERLCLLMPSVFDIDGFGEFGECWYQHNQPKSYCCVIMIVIIHVVQNAMGFLRYNFVKPGSTSLDVERGLWQTHFWANSSLISAPKFSESSTVWQSYCGVVGYLIIALPKIYC